MSAEKKDSLVSHWTHHLWDRTSQKIQITARLLMMAALVGVVSGLGAIAFEVLIQTVTHFSLDIAVGYSPRHPGGEAPLYEPSGNPFRWWMLMVVPSIGAFFSGLLVYWFAPEAAGHGTDAAIEAYHRKQGYIRTQVPIVKLITSAITLGTGGSGGREGPIAQIGAGFGSYLGRTLKLGPKERRVLMIAGMGAGIGAIFRAPLAGAIFAAEILYKDPEFEAEVIVPAGMATAVAYSTFAAYSGFTPLFAPQPQCKFLSALELFPYLILAIAMAALAALYIHGFYFVHDMFGKLKIHPVLKPIIGAFITGVIGIGFWFVFQTNDSLTVMSVGYGILQNFLETDGNITDLPVVLLFAVAFGKIVTTAFTIGSGGSGGVFGPAMVIGGCAGGGIGVLLHRWIPGLVHDPTAYMVVGMAGFFAAAAKTPFSTLLMVSEMTGNYYLLPPSMWVCLIAYLLSGERSLYRSQVTTHLRSPAHKGEYIRSVLANVTVDRFLDPDNPPLTIQLNEPLSAVVHELDGSHSLVLPVVGEKGEYKGMVCLEEVHLALHSPETAPLIVADDLMRPDVVPLYPGDTLYRAMELFGRNDLRALPIVRNESGVEKVIGIVRRSDVQTEYLKHVHGEREPSQRLP